MFLGECSLGIGGISNDFEGVFSYVWVDSFFRAACHFFSEDGSFGSSTQKMSCRSEETVTHTQLKNAMKTSANANFPGERSP